MLCCAVLCCAVLCCAVDWCGVRRCVRSKFTESRPRMVPLSAAQGVGYGARGGLLQVSSVSCLFFFIWCQSLFCFRRKSTVGKKNSKMYGTRLTLFL